jgi:ATP synthase F1 delta subunit
MLVRPQNARVTVNMNSLVNAQQRAFAKKKKGSKKAEGVTTDEEQVEEPVVHAEPEPVAEPVVQQMEVASKQSFSAASAEQPKETVSKDLFGAFSVGDVKQVQSVPGNKPPSQEDSIEGRYAYVLFSTASE